MSRSVLFSLLGLGVLLDLIATAPKEVRDKAKHAAAILFDAAGRDDERVEEVVEGKRQIANRTLPKSSSIGDLDAAQLQQALGIDASHLLDVADDELADTAEIEEMTS